MAVTAFYGEALGFPVVDKWDRARRSRVSFDLGGMRLEILDNRRKEVPLLLGRPPTEFILRSRLENIDTAYSMISIAAPAPKIHLFAGARLFELRDPMAIPIISSAMDDERSTGVARDHRPPHHRFGPRQALHTN
jgi:hypothetical protein